MIDNKSLQEKLGLQEKLISLLQEIDKICRENDIKYYIIEEALVAAVRGIDFPKERKDLTVAIYAEELKKFIDIAGNIDGRAVESLLNNDSFPGFYLKYVDVGTTLYNAAEIRSKYLYNSIGINICILMNKRTSKNKVIAFENKIMGMWAKVIARNGRSLKKSVFLMGKSLFSSKKAFKRYISTGKQGKFREVFLSDGDLVKLPVEMLGEGRDICIGGYKYLVPDDTDAVALKTNQDTLTLANDKNPHVARLRDIISTKYPGTEFVEHIKNKKINIKRCARKYYKYNEWRKNKYQPVWNRRIKFYDHYDLTGDRFHLYRELGQRRKHEIINMYDRGEFDKLYDILEEYIHWLIEYDMAGFGLYFDREVYIIAIKVIEYQIRKTEPHEKYSQMLITKIRKNIDKIFWQHLQPIYQYENGEIAKKEDMEKIRESIKKEINI